MLLKWLCKDGVEVVEKDTPDISEYHHLPETEALAERLRPCLQEGDDLPKDFTKLFDDKLFKFDTSLIPECVKLYKQMGVKHEPLSLIPPQFECPLPPLAPAGTFAGGPPTLRSARAARSVLPHLVMRWYIARCITGETTGASSPCPRLMADVRHFCLCVLPCSLPALLA